MTWSRVLNWLNETPSLTVPSPAHPKKIYNTALAYLSFLANTPLSKPTLVLVQFLSHQPMSSVKVGILRESGYSYRNSTFSKIEWGLGELAGY